MKLLSIGFCLAVFLSAASAPAVTIGQVDTFQDGLDNWQGGVGGFTLVPSGGPAGSGDQYLQVSSGHCRCRRAWRLSTTRSGSAISRPPA